MSFWADVVTFLAFAVTVFAAWKVFFINRDVRELSYKFSLKMMLRSTILDLKKYRKKLQGLLNSDCDLNNDTSITELIAGIHSLCDDLCNKANKLDMSIFSAERILGTCQEIKQRGRRSSADIGRLYSDTCKLTDDLDKIIRDMDNEVSL